jgi:HEPN domain-containing protein
MWSSLIHDIAQLLTLLERAGQEIPEPVRQAERLTRFAIFTRYPGVGPPVSHQEYEEAIAIAEEVVRWAEERILWPGREEHERGV